jgi:tRNA(His) 5'-end guanylyltransferase
MGEKLFDNIGKRLKENYELRTRYLLPRRTHTLIRADGKAFHTYTGRMEKPFDRSLNDAMDHAAIQAVAAIQGARLAYVQSDEISILATDFSSLRAEAWFDGNIQKITSISASMVTATFLASRREQGDDRLAFFDSRVWTIPEVQEVTNYFLWRVMDAERNSISMLAQAHFSPKQLHGKNTADMHEMLHTKGINWNDLEPRLKRGAFIVKEAYSIAAPDGTPTQRSRWVAMDNPPTSKERDRLHAVITDATKIEADL